MATTGVLLSTLARQLKVLGGGFSTRYPHAWLVWEPGNRVAAAVPQAIPATTVVPLQGRSRMPVAGDPLCFPLSVTTPGVPHRVGRAPENDIVIDDLTVSREHFSLWPEGDAWLVTVDDQSHATTMVRNMSLQPGEKMRLVDGCAILAGGVQLTFAAPGKLLPRVVAASERLRG